MQIETLISPDVIRVPLRAEDRLSAIRELIELLGAQGVVSDTESAIETTWTREQERTTGIGEGLAVPHGRCRYVDHLVLAIGRPATPIDFQSFDQKPVQLVVLVLSPPEDTASHIQVLGGISRLLSDRLTREAAYSAKSAEELTAVLHGAI
ncbi:MAG: PTS sugar transporter subunit IIA [Planctomycetes bacterium]|jgi:fructose-specific phosphotransferase system IIA component|nr:PTS sugar transporter subunit IIA [Planctomycetota bacterium]MCP4838318.1 PTS sugar transporter subunit IIA [Planctomycetota bacterium]